MFAPAVVLLVIAAFGMASCQTVVKVNVPKSGRITFQSPNYPSMYGINQYVHYVITAPKGLALQFDIEVFNMDRQTDSFHLTEILPVHRTVAFGTIVGKDGEMPTTFQSATNEVTGIFRSDNAASGAPNTGFKIGVQAISALTEPAVSESLVVNCTRGVLSWSEESFLNTDKTEVLLSVDRTIKCRQLMYEAHTFILEQQGKPAVGHSAQSPRPILVTCSSAGFSISETNPDDSEAESFSFKTTGNLKCRTIFVQFLNRISSKY